MLLVHQTGSLKVGEVVRYTLTYCPAEDPILPTPSHLHVKIKNTSPLPMRAAYLHGPYSLYVAAYSSKFNPNKKMEHPRRDGIPEFEPYLKAGGSWTVRLNIPEDVREIFGKVNAKCTTSGEPKSVSWIIEISSQVIFSASATVHFDLIVGRDETSLALGFGFALGSNSQVPGQLKDHQQGEAIKDGHHPGQPQGVFSKAIKMVVDDTESLWNNPPFPKWNENSENGDEIPRNADNQPSPTARDASCHRQRKTKKQKKIHLVILTHGLHGNLGGDMLYMKESIDAAARQARDDRRRRRKKETDLKGKKAQRNHNPGSHHPIDKPNHEAFEDSEEDEEVIVRGFPGNAVKTEQGIKYLGTRLARYVLKLTFPHQPFLPVKKIKSDILSFSHRSPASQDSQTGQPAHRGSSILKESADGDALAYKITSISFIGHSLGGLIQMYAIAYIQKHSPTFFDLIKPINFVAMATPFLGLSNENPIYVKFALDFGLVGRTGQDLGLTWRAPTIARNGWESVIGGIGSNAQRAARGYADPGSKPLLRILPLGPAHDCLVKFRNRTAYSNVVNDGIVPLRTSCLLFLDWRGLGRVEKARRENGLVGSMVEWGWNEMSGRPTTQHIKNCPEDKNDSSEDKDEESGNNEPTQMGLGAAVPQPSEQAAEDEEESSNGAFSKLLKLDKSNEDSSPLQSPNAFTSFLTFFKPSPQKALPNPSKHRRIYSISQTLDAEVESPTSSSALSGTPPLQSASTAAAANGTRPRVSKGDSLSSDPVVEAPPRTTFFESARDVLNPPIPSPSFLIDPTTRPRTIFHDRVYHPEDIPAPPPMRRKSGFSRSDTFDKTPSRTNTESTMSSSTDSHNSFSGPMKIEEKIARAYHWELSWRKVLVRLEPDAHNNMLVRRMFSNAYGWPVIKHLCETHFADTSAANLPDALETSEERAKNLQEGVGPGGEELKHDKMQADTDEADTDDAATTLEAADNVPVMAFPQPSPSGTDMFSSTPLHRPHTGWSDLSSEASFTSDDDEDETPLATHPLGFFLAPMVGRWRGSHSAPTTPQPYSPPGSPGQAPGTGGTGGTEFLVKAPESDALPLVTSPSDMTPAASPMPGFSMSEVGEAREVHQRDAVAAREARLGSSMAQSNLETSNDDDS